MASRVAAILRGIPVIRRRVRPTAAAAMLLDARKSHRVGSYGADALRRKPRRRVRGGPSSEGLWMGAACQ